MGIADSMSRDEDESFPRAKNSASLGRLCLSDHSASRTQRARGSRRPMPHRGNAAKRSSDNVISTEKAALLWMYCREVAPFETPSFRKKIGQLIAHATSTPAET